jgi:hypothetical protein
MADTKKPQPPQPKPSKDKLPPSVPAYDKAPPRPPVNEGIREKANVINDLMPPPKKK